MHVITNDTVHLYRRILRGTIDLEEMMFISTWQQMYNDHRTLLEAGKI